MRRVATGRGDWPILRPRRTGLCPCVPCPTGAQQRRGWGARSRPKAVKSRAGLGEAWADRSREQPTGRIVPLSSFSLFSEGRALTGTARGLTEAADGRVEWEDGIAKLRRRHSGWEGTQVDLEGRICEVITATSSASAEAARIPWLRMLPLTMTLESETPLRD